MNYTQLAKRWVFIALGVLIASETSAGISYESGAALVVAVLLLSVLNMFLRPLLMVLALPFIVLTMGIGIWFINALLFLMVGGLVAEFHVANFGSALWGALVVSLTGLFATMLFGDPQQRPRVNVRMQGARRPMSGQAGSTTQSSGEPTGRPAPRREIADDDVIDI